MTGSDGQWSKCHSVCPCLRISGRLAEILVHGTWYTVPVTPCSIPVRTSMFPSCGVLVSWAGSDCVTGEPCLCVALKEKEGRRKPWRRKKKQKRTHLIPKLFVFILLASPLPALGTLNTLCLIFRCQWLSAHHLWYITYLYVLCCRAVDKPGLPSIPLHSDLYPVTGSLNSILRRATCDYGYCHSDLLWASTYAYDLCHPYR